MFRKECSIYKQNFKRSVSNGFSSWCTVRGTDTYPNSRLLTMLVFSRNIKRGSEGSELILCVGNTDKFEEAASFAWSLSRREFEQFSSVTGSVAESSPIWRS